MEEILQTKLSNIEIVKPFKSNDNKSDFPIPSTHASQKHYIRHGTTGTKSKIKKSQCLHQEKDQPVPEISITNKYFKTILEALEHNKYEVLEKTM